MYKKSRTNQYWSSWQKYSFEIGRRHVHLIQKRGFGLWCLTPLSTLFFSYIVAVSFTGGGNRSTRRKPPICRKSLTNYITMLYRVHLAWAGFELTPLVVINTDCMGSCKSNYHTITAPEYLQNNVEYMYISKYSIYDLCFINSY